MLLSGPNKVFYDDSLITNLEPYFVNQFELGSIDGIQYCAAEVQKSIDQRDDFVCISLREALSLMPQELYVIGVKAFSMIHWDKSHQFCSHCGKGTVTHSKPLERLCPQCNVSFFPRISPSIIVLIHKNDELLMARGPRTPAGIYGLIAGFVEVGETVEEAVHREVQEEVGIKIKNISYIGSQPWPFPDALMLAFTAEYDSGEITVDNEEIEDAGWYHYDNLPGRPSLSISIASKMVDNFVIRCQEKQEKIAPR